MVVEDFPGAQVRTRCERWRQKYPLRVNSDYQGDGDPVSTAKSTGHSTFGKLCTATCTALHTKTAMTNYRVRCGKTLACCNFWSVIAAMAAWGQACRVAARAGAASFHRQGLLGTESHLSNGLASSTSQQIRGMASGKTGTLL